MVGAKAPKFLPPAAVGAEIGRTALAAQAVRSSVQEAADALERLKDVHLQAQSDLLLAEDTLENLKGQRSGVESEMTTLQYFIEAFTRSASALALRKAELDKLAATAEAELKACIDKDKASDRMVQNALDRKQELEAKLTTAKAEHDKARKRADLPVADQEAGTIAISGPPAAFIIAAKAGSALSFNTSASQAIPWHSKEAAQPLAQTIPNGLRPPCRERMTGGYQLGGGHACRRRSPAARRRRSPTPPRRRRRSPTPKRRRRSPIPPRRQRARSHSRDRHPPSSARRRMSPPSRQKLSRSRSPGGKGQKLQSPSPAAKLKVMEGPATAKATSPAVQPPASTEQPVVNSVTAVEHKTAAPTSPAAATPEPNASPEPEASSPAPDKLDLPPPPSIPATAGKPPDSRLTSPAPASSNRSPSKSPIANGEVSADSDRSRSRSREQRKGSRSSRSSSGGGHQERLQSKSPLRRHRSRSRSRGRRSISPRGDRLAHPRARRFEPVRVRSRTRDLFIDSLRYAIAQRRIPFNISVVSDFMRERDRFWKDDYPDVPFAQIARSLMDEGWVVLQTQRNGVMVVGSERLSDDVRRAEDALRFGGRSPAPRQTRRSPPPRRFDRPRSPPPRSQRGPSRMRQPQRSTSPPQMRYAAAVPEDGERWEMGHTGADDRWNPT